MYGIPYEYYEKYKVRRYGFHGTSHSFVSKRVAEIVGKPYNATKRSYAILVMEHLFQQCLTENQ